ncbi:hypothetical protein Rs2_04429 [Raphanus sativus]|nr:hypothetical protein Rs2_04429 [Raphanus sativus]
MGTHTTLAELSLFKPLRPVRVKVICKGTTEVGSTFEKSHLILGDENGNTIQATFFKDFGSSTEMPLEEGHCYEIKDFSLTATLELTRVSRNKLHIKLSKSSVISKIPPIPASNFYCFANFINLYRGLSHPKFSFNHLYKWYTDVYGAVVGVGFLEEYEKQSPGEINVTIDHKIRFYLVDMDFVHIKCVAYGALAFQFQEYWESTDTNVVLCVLQFWQIEWGVGRLRHLRSIDGFSKILFEPNGVPEIDYFRNK